jgi:hypothetical protein
MIIAHRARRSTYARPRATGRSGSRHVELRGAGGTTMGAFEPATLEILAATPAALRVLLAGLPAAAVERADAGGWSARDVVAHLVDRGRIQRERVERLLAEPGATIEDLDEQQTLASSGLRRRSLDELLALLERARREDVARYTALPDTAIARAGVHTVAGTITVAQLIHQAAYHDLLHLRQVAATLASFPGAGRGPLAMFG